MATSKADVIQHQANLIAGYQARVKELLVTCNEYLQQGREAREECRKLRGALVSAGVVISQLIKQVM